MKLKKCWGRPKSDFLDNKLNLSFRENLKRNTEEFCRNTTLHGMRYVTDNRLKRGERCFFGLSILIVICLAVYLIHRVYDKWSTSPVIVGINPEPNFITNEPFPAVTICNINQAVNTKVAHYSKDSAEYAMLQLLCKRKVNATLLNTFSNWNSLENFIVNISQTCNDMLLDCQFGGKDQNCSSLFYPLVTDEGLCCVFNMLHPNLMYASYIPDIFRRLPNNTIYKAVNWNAETGYDANLPRHISPQRILGIGESVGLSVTLNVQKDQYYCSSSSSVGLKFSIHPPNEAPNVRETGVFIETGKETKLRVSHNNIKSDPHLRSIRKELRHCVFRDEGNLKFFAHYTQRNCEKECVAGMVLRHCGCVSYFMPKFYENISTCSLNQLDCERMIRLRMKPNVTCCLDDCMPSCNDVNYLVDTFSAKLSTKGFDVVNPKIQNMSEEYLRDNIAIVHMYFSEHSFRSFIQTEFFGISDFFSNIGGLMGLFLGFSFLSIAELIYYAIIRPCNAIQQYKLNRITDGSAGGVIEIAHLPTQKKIKKPFHQISRKKYQSKTQYPEKTSPYWLPQDFSVKVETPVTYY